MVQQELIQVSKEEYESMKETIEIFSNKKLMKDIKEGIEDIKEGRFITFEDFKNNCGTASSLIKIFEGCQNE